MMNGASAGSSARREVQAERGSAVHLGQADQARVLDLPERERERGRRQDAPQQRAAHAARQQRAGADQAEPEHGRCPQCPADSTGRPACPARPTISPACWRPMNAMNSPMPTAMPFRMLGLIASMTASRTRSSVSRMNATPDRNTIPSAVCQASGTPSAAERHDHGDEEEVLAHAGRQRDRVVGEQPHEDRGQRRSDAGGHEHRAEVHPGRLAGQVRGQHRRLHEDDVGHRQERGQAGQHLRADVRPARGQLEAADSSTRSPPPSAEIRSRPRVRAAHAPGRR